MEVLGEAMPKVFSAHVKVPQAEAVADPVCN